MSNVLTMRQAIAQLLCLAATAGCIGAPSVSANPKSTPKVTAVPAVVEAMQKKYGLPSNTPVTVKAKQVPVVSLGQLVDLQRLSYPQAVVTSTFFDYRTVSMYRRNPGLHLGYDIAMPAQSAVRVGWPGTVVSIAPWSDYEWGVTVQSSNGTEVTYGHITPGVHIGQQLEVGSVVGLVAVNHVDVKMRDANGSYVPFGEGKGATDGHYSYTRVIPTSTREQLMVSWLTEHNSLETSEQELELRQREAKLAAAERKRLEERYAQLKDSIPLMTQYAQDGLIAKVDLEKLLIDTEKARKELAACKATQLDSPKRILSLEKQIKASRNRLAAAQKKARERGISWNEVSSFVNAMVAKDRKLSQTVTSYKQSTQSKDTKKLALLKKQVKEGQAKLEQMEKLYEMGGLSRKEIESMRLKQRTLQAELNSLQAQD